MISLDSKRFLRKKKFWIALTSILIIIVMIFVNFNDNTYDEIGDAYGLQYAESTVPWECDDEEYFDKVQAIADKIEPALKKEDWKTLNQTMSDLYYIQAGNALKLSEGENTDLYYHDYFRGKENVEKQIKKRNLPVLDDELIEYMFFDRMRSDTNYTDQFQELRLKAEYYQNLAKHNIKSTDYGMVDSSTMIVQFLRVMFPLLPILIAALMCYDSMQEDKDSGIIKVLLTQPMKRSKYLKKKIMINIKAVTFIFFVPLLMMSLCYGVFDHFGTRRAPVLSNVQGITTLKIQDNTLKEIENGETINRSGSMPGFSSMGPGYLGITKYYPIPVNSQSPNPEYDFLEMWQFAGLCSIMAILVLAFYVLLSTLFAVVTKNKIVALVLSLLVLLVGMFFAKASNMDMLFAWLPFTYMNPVDILSGYSSYSYLNGILVLGITNIALYFITAQMFKRKDTIG